MSRAARGTVALVAVIMVAAGTAGAYAWWQSDRQAEAAVEQPRNGATAEVTRETIALTETFDGTLGHGESTTGEAAGQGVLTSVLDADSAIERDSEVYAVNEVPVIALIGSIPIYRDLAPGDVGGDVKQLERNLDALGYQGFEVDDSYTWATATAVEQWQDDHQLQRTGAVRSAEVIFVPAGSRVESVRAEIGDRLSPGTPVLDVTGDDQQVAVEAEVADRELLSAGAEVSVETADGERVVGTVRDVAVTAAASGSEQGSGQGTSGDQSEAEPILAAQIELKEELPADLVGSPVDVLVDVEQHQGVLAVPVSALLAVAGGGYAVEVIGDDGSAELVPVDTGLFADGFVEVSGAGIREGVTVGVAGR